MKNNLLVLSVLISPLITHHVSAQTSILFSGSYAENFDSMGAAGTSLPAGWTGLRYAGSGTLGAALDPVVTTGSSSGGGLYNVGASGDGERALGTVGSGPTVPRFGLQLVNASGSTIDSLSLDGVSEQWRTGNSAVDNERILFEYSLNALDINDPNATFVGLAGLDLFEIQTGSTSGGAINGNDSANQATIAGLLAGLNWGDGTTLTLRWSDVDAAGNDGMFALDNLSVSATAVPEPSAVAFITVGTLMLIWRKYRR
jgi:hypothetical protein